MRYFKGRIGSAGLDVRSKCGHEVSRSIELRITNLGAALVVVNVLDAYSGNCDSQLLEAGNTFECAMSLD